MMARLPRTIGSTDAHTGIASATHARETLLAEPEGGGTCPAVEVANSSPAPPLPPHARKPLLADPEGGGTCPAVEVANSSPAPPLPPPSSSNNSSCARSARQR